jgi:hypothetical protein
MTSGWLTYRLLAAQDSFPFALHSAHQTIVDKYHEILVILTSEFALSSMLIETYDLSKDKDMVAITTTTAYGKSRVSL